MNGQCLGGAKAIRDLHQTCKCQGWYLSRCWVQGCPTFPPSAVGPAAWARSWADRAGVIGPAEQSEAFPRRAATQQVVVVKLGSSCSYVHLFNELTNQLVSVQAKSHKLVVSNSLQSYKL